MKAQKIVGIVTDSAGTIVWRPVHIVSISFTLCETVMSMLVGVSHMNCCFRILRRKIWKITYLQQIQDTTDEKICHISKKISDDAFSISC